METLIRSIAKLDSWFESVRQPRGYAGPVAHWWQHCMLYTGPGIDWRYEGILSGYQLLYQKTSQLVWKQRLRQATEDVIRGQRRDGSYLASQFEMNPGILGTPHEAAATLGLLNAFKTLQDERILLTARRNLDLLIRQLWDEDQPGFNDRPGVRGRVPNKLATLAESLMVFYDLVGEESYLNYAKNSIDAVLQYQEGSGAIHQYAHEARYGDSKFFPFYNARCIPPLIRAEQVFNDQRYKEAAQRTLSFVDSSMNPDGSWSQVVYPNGKRVQGPRWIAGAADILRAYRLCDREVPRVAYERVLEAQLDSGGFPTAEGFIERFRPSRRGHRNQGEADGIMTFVDILPVVGWNDKIFRFLTEQLGQGSTIPLHPFLPTHSAVRDGRYVEQLEFIEVTNLLGRSIFRWNKSAPWSQCSLEAFA